MGSTQICRGFTDVQWKELRKRLIHGSTIQNDEDAWKCAIEVFERRIKERFLSCIEVLQSADSRSDVEVDPNAPADCSSLPQSENDDNCLVPGFAVMALSCLLIETLQSFLPRPGPRATTNQAFKEFLQRPSFRGEFLEKRMAARFADGIRNGILHDAKTKGWLIWRDEPDGRIVAHEGEQYALNRTEFCNALKTEFNDYIRQLHDPLNSDLRRTFLERMESLVESC